MTRWHALTFAALTACAGTTSEQLATCTLTLTVPDAVVAGATADFGLDPISEPWDIVAHIGGLSAPVVETASVDCDACDTCRTENVCGACDSTTTNGTCATCADACATCRRTVTLQVPDVAPGTWPIVIVHRYGESAPALVDVSASTSEPSNDSGAPVGP